MNVLSRIVGMKKLCVVLGGLGLLSTGAWAQDGGYSGQVGGGGAYGQSPSYGTEGVPSGGQGTLQAPGSGGGASAAGQVEPDAGTGIKQDRGPIQNPSAAPKDGVQFALGVGLGTGPRYLGSDETATSPSAIFSVQYGPFFLDSMRGLGAEYSTPFGLHMSAALSYDPGRAEKNEGGNYWSSGSEKLQGLGKIKRSTTINVDLSQDVTDWLAVNVGGEFAISGQKHRGNQYTTGLTLRPWTTETDQVELGLSALFGDKDYNRTYFGVTPEQSLRSRYGQFNAESGVYAYSLGAQWTHVIDEHWATLVAGEYQQFSSKIKKSPIVRDSSGVTAVVGLHYTF